MFYGTAMPGLAYGPYDTKLRAKGTAKVFWTPVIEGDVVRMELRLKAGIELPQRSIELPQVSHLLASLRRPGLWEKNLANIGDSGFCEIDLACHPEVAAQGGAVAKYIFTKDGSSYLCTGTMLNSESGADFFLTAHHCVSEQIVASTMDLYWSFQRATCNGADPTSVTQTSGGGTLLTTGEANDFTLVQLSANPPGGTLLSGWTTTKATPGTNVYGIHHPAGDLKKVSFGTTQGFSNWNAPPSSGDTSTHIDVGWSEGVTEGGSSGSGLFRTAAIGGDVARRRRFLRQT